MLVSLSSERRHKILKEVKHWHSGRKSFTIIEAVQLLGVVENWAEISPWVRFILSALRLAVTKALRSSREIVCKRKEVLNLAREVANDLDISSVMLRKKFLERKIATDIYHSRVKIFVTTQMAEELRFLTQILEDIEGCPLSCPIAHLIPREPDCQTFGDACLDAAGGFSDCLGFWWHVQFPNMR